MSEAQAVVASREIQERFPDVDADALDPRQWMTLHMDRSTVEDLRDCLEARGRTGIEDRSFMIDAFAEWLEQAASQEDQD